MEQVLRKGLKEVLPRWPNDFSPLSNIELSAALSKHAQVTIDVIQHEVKEDEGSLYYYIVLEVLPLSAEEQKRGALFHEIIHEIREINGHSLRWEMI